jgi:hypothetical protein
LNRDDDGDCTDAGREVTASSVTAIGKLGAVRGRVAPDSVVAVDAPEEYWEECSAVQLRISTPMACCFSLVSLVCASLCVRELILVLAN